LNRPLPALLAVFPGFWCCCLRATETCFAWILSKPSPFQGQDLSFSLSLVRVEALDPELAEDGALRAARLMNPGSVPIPIGLADRVSRRLNGAAVKLLASTSPLRLTYEGLEELNRSLMELGD